MADRTRAHSGQLLDFAQCESQTIHSQAHLFYFLGVPPLGVGFNKLAIARFAAIVLFATSMTNFSDLLRSTMRPLHIGRACRRSKIFRRLRLYTKTACIYCMQFCRSAQVRHCLHFTAILNNNLMGVHLLMRIKVINPNTTASITAKIGAAARVVASPGTEIVACHPAMGPVAIEGHYDEALSVIGVLDEIRKGEADGMDGYVIACFGDPGLLAARELAKAPVLGIAEAAMHAASFMTTGFSIVTTLERTRGIAQDLVDRYGMTRFCRQVRAIDLPVLSLEDGA